MFNGLRGLFRSFFGPPPSPEPIHVVDGDTLRAGKERMRMLYMDAPESGQLDGSGQDAGAAAQAMLHHLVSGQDIRISRHGQDVYGRTLVKASTPKIPDLAIEMVRRGYAIALQDAPPEYHNACHSAIAARTGLWARGGFEEPYHWRKRQTALTGVPWKVSTPQQPTLQRVQPRPQAVGRVPTRRGYDR